MFPGEALTPPLLEVGLDLIADVGEEKSSTRRLVGVTGASL